MPGPLTGGFDAAAQVSEDFMGALLGAFYNMGRIPSLQSVTAPLGGQDVTLDVYIGQPSLSFNATTPVTLTLHIPLIVRGFSDGSEADGTFSFDLTPTLQRDGGVARLVLDLTQVTTGVGLTWKTAPALVDAVTPIVDQLVTDTLNKQVVTIPLGPTSSPMFSHVDMRLYTGPSEIDQLNAQPSGDPIVLDNNFLGVFVDRSRNVVAPDAFQSTLERYNGATPADWSFNHDSWDPDYAVMVSAEIVDGVIAAGIAALGLPRDVGSGVTLNDDLAITRDPTYGLLHITGSATKIVQASFDIYVALSIEVDPASAKSKLVVTPTKVDIELPDWLTFLVVGIVPLFGQDIIDYINQQIAAQTAALGLSVTLPNLKTVADGVELSDFPDAGATLGVALLNNGSISFTADGAVAWGNVELSFAQADISKPPYFWGNIHTSEFHDDACPYGQMAKETRRFIRPEDAIAAGYDGCAHCLPQYEAIAPGELLLSVLGPAHSGGTDLTFTWMQLVPGSSSGSTVPGAEQTPHADVSVKGLQTGTWRVGVKSPTWETSSETVVQADTRTIVLFTFGSDAVKVSYTDVPPHKAAG